MKFGIRTPSFRKRLAARTSWKRVVRHSLGFKAPRGWGWLTNPKRAAYNRVYNRTSISVGRLFRRRRGSRHGGGGLVFVLLLGCLLLFATASATYLLVVGMVGLVGWLIRIATAHSSPVPAPEKVAAALPALPSPEYLVLSSVDPSTFDDPELVQSAAREVFATWLRQMPRAPKKGADLVSGVAVQERLVGRLVTESKADALLGGRCQQSWADT